MTRKKSKQNTCELQALMTQNADWMQPMVQWLIQEVLEAQMTEALGAAKGERSESRQGYRSGYYTRQLVTRVGTMELRVPQDRLDGVVFPNSGDARVMKGIVAA